MLRVFWQRLKATFWPAPMEQRLEHEVQDHLEQLSLNAAEHGMPAAEARLAARREFGSPELAKELYRDQARFRVLEYAWRDLAYAMRQCRKNKTFTAAAVASIALGIGANTALFSFVNAILMQRLPVPDPDALYLLEHSGTPKLLSFTRLNALKRDAKTIDGMLGTFPMAVSVSVGEQPEWLAAELVTGDYFRTLQIKAERGRLMTEGDLEAAGGDPTCVISHRFWKGRLHGAENAVGRTIRLNSRPYRILGVTEEGFGGTDLQKLADLEIPATRIADYLPAFVGVPGFDWQSRLSLFSTMVRLKPGEAASKAATELTRLNREAETSARKDEHAGKLELKSGGAGLQSAAKLGQPAFILLGVSLLVLLIACSNLAALLLSRISARSSEFALRLALGGSRRRVLGQVLTESTLLAGMGTVAGVGLAYGMSTTLLWFINRSLPPIHQMQIAPNGTVLAFVALLCAMCIVLFGSAPAMQAAKTAALGSSAGNAEAGAGLRRWFVTAQIALSFAVVLSAGLLLGTLRNLRSVDLGYAPDEIAAVELRPAAGGYRQAEANQFYARVVDRYRMLPGVRSASTTIGVNYAESPKMKIASPKQPGSMHEVNIYGVSRGYFATMGAHILAGRDFDDHDNASKAQVYIISEHLARRLFPGENAVGRYLLNGGQRLPIIGVASNIHDQAVGEASLDTVYQYAGQLLVSSMTILVRCAGPCGPLLPSLRHAVQEVDRNMPALSVKTLQTEREGAFSSQQILGFLSSLFAVLSLLLVGAGLYGVLAYTLHRRTKELGIRMALGASIADIVWQFVTEAAGMVGLGLGLGIPAALGAVTLLRSQLFGVEPYDLRTLGVCTVCVLGAIGAAFIGPLRGALRIAPQQALRSE